MAEIRHLENRHYVNFLCWRQPSLDKILQTGAERDVDCGDMVESETRSRIPICWRFWGIQWHVIPEPHATLQGERIPSAILKIVSPYFIVIFCFSNVVWALASSSFHIISDTLVIYNTVGLYFVSKFSEVPEFEFTDILTLSIGHCSCFFGSSALANRHMN